MATIITKEDVETLELLRKNEENRLETVQTRAKSWLGAISAISLLFGFAFVVPGPSTVTDVSMIGKMVIFAPMLLGFLFFTCSVYLSYQAAYGSPTDLVDIDTTVLPGLHAKVTQAKRAVADIHQKEARKAIGLFFCGVLMVVAALGASWFVPRGEVDCFFVGVENKTVVAKIRGGTVESYEYPITIVGACP